MAEPRAGEQKSAAMRVKLKYPDVETFLAKYGPNISRGGIFISTKTPKPVGTPIRFDFLLLTEGGERSVLRGEGTVNFVREADPAVPNPRSGMGVRFTKLLDDGQALVDRALRMRGSQASMGGQPEPPPPPDLPSGVREVTGEVELQTGPVPRLNEDDEDEPLPPPREIPPALAPTETAPPTTTETAAPAAMQAAPASASVGPDLDQLAREAGVSTERVAAMLGRRGSRGIDASQSAAELDALLSAHAPEPTSATEASARIDDLLSRRRR